MFELFDAITLHARRTPDRIAIRQVGHPSITYRQLVDATKGVCRLVPEKAQTVALSGTPSAAWIVADLAVTLLGRRLVPIPYFFSGDQTRHIHDNAAVDFLIDTGGLLPVNGSHDSPDVLRLTTQLALDSRTGNRSRMTYGGGAERVIYTSGTTGRPKGVRHGDPQLSHAAGAIATVVSARATDRHLSLLPPALLLEQVAGQFVPLITGAEIVIDSDAGLASLSGGGPSIAQAIDRARPSTTILVPQRLRQLAIHAERTGWRPPDTLRLVAVGGAPLPRDVLASARKTGLPVGFGYGLSECCSVVSLQTATDGDVRDDDVPSAGHPLPGCEVWTEDGELVVRSPTVMIGYLGERPLETNVWRTGDLGRIDADGRITVYGRRDRRLVMADGRMVSPEWIESLALGESQVSAACATLDDDGAITVAIDLAVGATRTGAADGGRPLARCIADRFSTLPGYARPRYLVIVGSRVVPLDYLDRQVS